MIKTAMMMMEITTTIMMMVIMMFGEYVYEGDNCDDGKEGGLKW